jgi:tetratricopeptide (TPR) repeat protein
VDGYRLRRRRRSSSARSVSWRSTSAAIPPAGSLRDIGDNGAPSPLLPSGALTGIPLPSDLEAGGRLRLPDGTAIPATTSGAGAALADELLATMAHYVTTDNLVGPAPLVNVVPKHVAYIEELLIQHADAPERLLYVGARFAEFAGWLYQGTGDARAALQWSNVALEFARHCGDPQLTSYIWMRKSNIGSDARRAQLAIAFAGAALEDAKALTPHQRAVALRQEAHAHALAGDADASARAIDLAYSFASRPAGSKDDIAQYCTPAYVEMEAAHCLIELGRPDQAIATLQRGLADWHPAFRRDLGLGLARLAVAHARAEDADNAVAIAEHALAIALDTRSRRTADQLSRLPGLLQAIGADEPARHLRHRLTALR